MTTSSGVWYPKHHLFVHVCEHTQTTGINPKLEWCYGDESEIGEAAALAKRCHANHLGSQLLEKYRAHSG